MPGLVQGAAQTRSRLCDIFEGNGAQLIALSLPCYKRLPAIVVACCRSVIPPLSHQHCAGHV
jgi:hypothetical protein